MSDAGLVALAEEAGLAPRWRNALGAPRTVAPENLHRLLGALGYPSGSEADIAESRERLRREAGSSRLITSDVGAPIRLPSRLGAGPARLTLESGESRDLTQRDVAAGLLPPIDEPGYHRLQADDAEIVVAVAPRRACSPSDLAEGPLWGVGLQLYSLQDDLAPDVGDFGALARFAAALGDAGASLLAVSPTHALFAADSSRFSPYAPSTRLFTHALHADPASLHPDAARPSAGARPLIDWPAIWAARMQALEASFGRFQRDGGDGRRADFEAFRRNGGDDLESHALFEAIHDHFFRRDRALGWREWPEAFRDRHSPAVAAFAQEHAPSLDFHLFVQWLADRGLGAAQAAARAAGMPIGLVSDLAVGMDPGGSHAWSRPRDLLKGVNIGAPPDVWMPAGQDWGITGFAPAALRATGYDAFLATIRAALRHAGGLRIDHAMGLQRLWLVPHGEAASEGAYLSYPFEDLIRLLTLESWRSRAIVIAEDLGTVPERFSETLQERGMLGMQVLWFERLEDGGFRAPGDWSPASAALTTTHDLPTVAGWWQGRDLEWIDALARPSAHASPDEARSVRAEDRTQLWDACRRAGVAEGPAPPQTEPARAVDAALGFVAGTASPVVIVAAEDLAGLVEQPNLPGTLDEHPNWRRRLPPTRELLAAPDVKRRIAALAEARPRAGAKP
jgi:4-alpha-glucanotransferase